MNDSGTELLVRERTSGLLRAHSRARVLLAARERAGRPKRSVRILTLTLGLLLCLASDHDIASDRTYRSSTSDVARGRYVVAISSCNNCHTEGYMERGEAILESELLTGGALGWRGPWGTTYAINLRLYFDQLTEEQWTELARERQRRPPMPYYALNAMSEADLRAVYRYIRHLGPAGKPSPAFVAPGQEPSTPYVSFPTPRAPSLPNR
jgi:mono/diheme cytochrome c family protein